MTVKKVCEKYGITPDTLRYYERIGVIPSVNRTEKGIRDYTEQDIGWVENALCMRNAGVPVDMIAEYVRLCRQGDETFSARRDLLKEARLQILKQLAKYQAELERLEYKISRYEAAVDTGKLVWDGPDPTQAELKSAWVEEGPGGFSDACSSRAEILRLNGPDSTQAELKSAWVEEGPGGFSDACSSRAEILRLNGPDSTQAELK